MQFIRSNIKKWVWLLGIALSHPIQALDLSTAVQLGVSNHPSITSKRMDQDSASKSATGSLWQVGPSFTYTNGKDTYGNKTSTSRIEQPLFTGGRVVNSIKQAYAQRDVADADALSAEQNMIGRISDSYFETLRLKERINAALKNVKEHQRLFTLIQRRAKAGVSSESDTTTANMRLQQALSEYAQMMAQESTARNTLSELIGETITPDEALNPTNDPPLNLNLDEAKSLALEFSPDILSQRYKADVASAKSAVQRSALLPQVFLRHENTHSSNAAANIPSSQTYIAVEYQLGAGVSSFYAWDAAISQRKSADAMIASTEKDLISNLTKQWNTYALNKTQMSILEKQLDASQKVLDSFLRQYTIGKRTWLDVLNTQKELAQTQYTIADTRASLFQAKAQIGLMTGILRTDTTDLVLPNKTQQK